MLLVQGKLERHSCTVSEDVSCHAVDLYEQEARLKDIAFVAIQQAETAWSLEPTSVHWYTSPLQIARLARRAVQRRVITCTTPSQDWPHPQPGRVNTGAAKYRTTRQVCSLDKLSFVPRWLPHIRSLSILGSTPDTDRCTTAPLDVSGRLTRNVHDTHIADTTYTWWWLCALIYLPSSRPSRCELGTEKCTTRPSPRSNLHPLVELAS
jgi:hypothetical protein